MYPHGRSLVERLADKPFAPIGVNSDEDREGLKEVLEEGQIARRSFRNGPEGTGGPISQAWHVRGRPRMPVLRLVHCGLTRVLAAEVAGLGRATVQQYVAAYRDGRLDGLRRWGVTGPVSDLAAHTAAIRDSLTAARCGRRPGRATGS